MACSFTLYVVGFPSLYGGAGAELYHQLILWRHMNVAVHIIPTQQRVETSQLYRQVLDLGVVIHRAWDWESIPRDAPVLSFCNEDFLTHLPAIRRRTSRTIFINCMTWLFPGEREAMLRGDISMFLYQNGHVRQRLMPQLQALRDSPRVRYLCFRPYFDPSAFPFISARPSDHFCAGHISRHDADKFSRDMWHIYESFDAPVPKQGLCLGFNQISAAKTGPPPAWVRTCRDQKELSQQEFYRRCHVVLQPTDTTENWPRVGLEAMASGSVLIVNKRGGWEQMVEHGKTGWLCEDAGDFIACATKMAWEPHLRQDMAAAARERGRLLSGREASQASWQEVFAAIDTLPESRPCRPAPSILIGICSHAQATGRRQAIRDTWLRRLPSYCRAVFFIGGGCVPAGEEADVVALDAPDSYQELPQKIFAFLRYALSDPVTRWIFKCDDDTYLHPRRLHTLLQAHAELVGDMSVKRRGAPSGGAGSLLPRHLAERLLEQPPLPATGAEDLIIGELARRLGACMIATPRLYHSNTTFPARWNRQITAHWCSPDIMKTIDSIC